MLISAPPFTRVSQIDLVTRRVMVDAIQKQGSATIRPQRGGRQCQKVRLKVLLLEKLRDERKARMANSCGSTTGRSSTLAAV
jgi:hypothetical protein